jgi:pathogenesis-related protein 1
MANEMVAAHNAWRQQYNLNGLSWASDLAQFAQNYANQLAASGCQMVHSTGNGFGENLAWGSPRTISYSDGRVENQLQAMTAKSVTDSWGNEVQWYDYNSNSCNAPAGESCGHYTQVIWNTTQEVGCAMAVCPDNGQIWSCNYRPAGNVVGQRPY